MVKVYPNRLIPDFHHTFDYMAQHLIYFEDNTYIHSFIGGILRSVPFFDPQCMGKVKLDKDQNVNLNPLFSPLDSFCLLY